jgi:hypothetical protein
MTHSGHFEIKWRKLHPILLHTCNTVQLFEVRALPKLGCSWISVIV